MDLTVNRNRAINYWWGMSADVTELICSGKIPFMTELIRKGQFRLFDTELTDNEGVCRQKEGAHMSHAQIVKMDWLLDNVEGRIPTFGELKDEALPLVMLQGDVAPDES